MEQEEEDNVTLIQTTKTDLRIIFSENNGKYLRYKEPRKIQRNATKKKRFAYEMNLEIILNMYSEGPKDELTTSP